MKTGVAEEADEPKSEMVNGLDGTTARWVTHPGHTPDSHGLVASYLRKDWGPTEYDPIVRYGRYITGPPAVNSSSSDTEETPTLMNRTSDNDDSSLNPTGKFDSDNRSLEMRKKLLKIGTWNVRTLFKAAKMHNLTKEMDSMKLDILGVCETRWTESGKLTDKDKSMVYSGGQKHQYGVEIANAMIGFWPVSERLIMVKLNGKPFDVNIIQIYATTQDHTENETEEFYDNLQKLMEYTKSAEVNIIMGDLNAKVGKGAEHPVEGNYGLGTRNDRGSKLIKFCKGNNLLIMNTMFKHHPKNIHTWKSPGYVYRNQIDYIMINDRFRNSVKNVKTHPGADIDSDHNPVVMTLKLKLKTRQKPRKLSKIPGKTSQQAATPSGLTAI
uniref:Endonuclease/exonuclease/phosphatase domain-containing protein n=1 Tax=Acanthochromis polyacanthus TaxID=80966 RepID=A0A3Q1EK63_9TELE